MPSAEIITIGTELLLGEITDTNTQYIAKAFRSCGINLFRSTTIGDNLDRIAAVVKDAMQRSEIIITTGGLGPTVDDPTRTAIAAALGTTTEFKPELWQQIQERYKKYGRTPTENNRRQAYIPKGAIAIENPVGTAPAFITETSRGVIISLPGVPKEMEYLLDNSVLPYLKERFDLNEIIKSFTIQTAGEAESKIDELIGDLETGSNPTVGLVAHPGQIDIRITAKAKSESEADQMIATVKEDIEKRLGKMIFAYGRTPLSEVLANELKAHFDKIIISETGTEDLLSETLVKYGVKVERPSIINHNQSKKQDPVLELTLYQEPEILLSVVYRYNDEISQKDFYFGGHQSLAQKWAINMALNYLRYKLIG